MLLIIYVWHVSLWIYAAIVKAYADFTIWLEEDFYVISNGKKLVDRNIALAKACSQKPYAKPVVLSEKESKFLVSFLMAS
jgi:hypothetical protein